MVETLVTNITATSGFITDYHAQGFVTGSNTKRYTLTSVGIAIAGIVGANDTTTVKIRKNKVNNGKNEPDNRNSGLVATLMNPSMLSSPLKKALLTGFHSTAKHNATKVVSPSSETMRTI